MASNWEEELRKLLEGEAPVPPPPPLPPPPVVRREPAPPPVIVVQPSRQAPPPLVAQPRQAPPPMPVPQPVIVVTKPRSLPVAVAIPDDDHERHEGSGHLATMAESAQAYLRGGQVHERIAERMRQVDARTEQARPTAVAARGTISADAAAVLKLLRQPQTARQVMIASFILSPPKGLEG